MDQEGNRLEVSVTWRENGWGDRRDGEQDTLADPGPPRSLQSTSWLTARDHSPDLRQAAAELEGRGIPQRVDLTESEPEDTKGTQEIRPWAW